MAATRARTPGSFGQAFAPMMIDGSTPEGQPVMIRMQGVPTMPGYRDRPGKWNVVIPPIVLIGDWLSELIEKLF